MLVSLYRALDHPILRPKLGPIPNAKKCVFSPSFKKNPSQFDKKIFFSLSPSFFHIIIQIQNILLHIYNFTEK